MKLGALVDESARRLRAAGLSYGHGTDNARDEAAFLVLRGLGLPFHARDRELADAQVRKARALVERRIRLRMPAAYLLREAWLADHRFYVDRRVIIPRSHIAELLDQDLPSAKPERILDLCTGSGCLAILAALAFPHARVDAVDLSKPALAVAAKNVAHYKLGKRVRLLRSDLFESLREEKYDLIITNPPYVERPAMRALPQEYRHEPRMALAGGADGMDLVRRIVRDARAHLQPKGALVCEIGAGRKALLRAFPRLRFTWPETAAGGGQVFLLRAPY